MTLGEAFVTNAAPSSQSLRKMSIAETKPTRLPLRLDLRYRLDYALLRFLVGLVRLFPLDIAADISGWAWRTLGPRNHRHQRALRNIGMAFPDMPFGEKDRIVREMWDNLGRVMVETMMIDRIVRQPERIELVDDFFVKRYKGKLGPVVLVGMHMGNWELSMWPSMLADVQPAAVYRLLKNPYSDAYLRAQRRELFPGGLFGRGRAAGTEEGQKTARVIMDFVRRGGRLGLIADLYDKQGIPVPFFGHPAKSTPMPAMIVRRTGSRMWIGRCVRKGRTSTFWTEVREQKVPRTANQAEDIRWVTAEIQKQFEAWIRETPEQFMWTNRRWS